jgi:hypothetical protein
VNNALELFIKLLTCGLLPSTLNKRVVMGILHRLLKS